MQQSRLAQQSLTIYDTNPKIYYAYVPVDNVRKGVTKSSVNTVREGDWFRACTRVNNIGLKLSSIYIVAAQVF